MVVCFSELVEEPVIEGAGAAETGDGAVYGKEPRHRGDGIATALRAKKPRITRELTLEPKECMADSRLRCWSWGDGSEKVCSASEKPKSERSMFVIKKECKERLYCETKGLDVQRPRDKRLTLKKVTEVCACPGLREEEPSTLICILSYFDLQLADAAYFVAPLWASPIGVAEGPL